MFTFIIIVIYYIITSVLYACTGRRRPAARCPAERSSAGSAPIHYDY